MNCRSADSLIQSALDTPLSPPERARLDSHLATCDACRRAWDEYRQLSQTAAVWARQPVLGETPADEFTAQVLSRLAASPSSALRPVGWAGLAYGAALVLLLAASPFVSPLLPPLPAWHLTWNATALPDLGIRLHALPRDLSGAWADAADALASARWAALLLMAALPINALLCLRARRGVRRSA